MASWNGENRGLKPCQNVRPPEKTRVKIIFEPKPNQNTMVSFVSGPNRISASGRAKIEPERN
eukprot:6426066-Pyramimonas_sp.AAC.1